MIEGLSVETPQTRADMALLIAKALVSLVVAWSNPDIHPRQISFPNSHCGIDCHSASTLFWTGVLDL
jgi:hypothetical protein